MSIRTERIAVVTGGSRGIGRAIAGRLAEDGYGVLLVALNPASLERARTEIAEATGAMVESLSVDLRTPGSGEQVLAAVRAKFERVDVLVNSAGATKGGPFLELGEEVWSDGFALKFFGAVRMCRALWPELVKTRGSIVNIGGGFSRTPSPDFTIAGSVNAALANFSKALAGLGLRDDVNVNVIHPGTTVTDRLDEIVETRSKSEGVPTTEIRKNLAASEAIRRLGEPSDVAALVAFLCRPEARHIQGTAIAVDGGATRSVF